LRLVRRSGNVGSIAFDARWAGAIEAPGGANVEPVNTCEANKG
jgi:hypothetical protein